MSQSVLSLHADVRLLPEQFAELSEADSRLQKVRLVLVLPRCTASALTDPVAHIIHEDGGTATTEPSNFKVPSLNIGKILRTFQKS